MYLKASVPSWKVLLLQQWFKYQDAPPGIHLAARQPLQRLRMSGGSKDPMDKQRFSSLKALFQHVLTCLMYQKEHGNQVFDGFRALARITSEPRRFSQPNRFKARQVAMSCFGLCLRGFVIFSLVYGPFRNYLLLFLACWRANPSQQLEQKHKLKMFKKEI